MKIFIITDQNDIIREMEYLCMLFSSILDADFIVKRPDDIIPETSPIIFYSKTECQIQNSENAKIHIIPDEAFWSSYLCNAFPKLKVVAIEDSPVYISQDIKLSFKTEESITRTNIDIFSSAFFIITRMEETFGAKNFDQHGRYQYKNSITRSKGIQRPIVNEYAGLLIEWIRSICGLHLKLRQDGFYAVITHDIDIPFRYGTICRETSEIFHGLKGKGSYSLAKELLRYVLFLVGVRKDPYETYSYFMEVEREYGVRSTYFLLRDGSNAWGLDDRRYKRIVKALVDAGHEIALHPGYDSYLDPDRIASEKASVEALSGLPVMGVRNHFLRFKVPESYRLVEKLGLFYDSTLGYAEQEGFRAGICSPFNPYDIEERRPFDIVEVPLVVMDGTLQDYRGMTPDEAKQSIRKLVDTVAKYKGTIVFNWHNTFFAESGNSWERVFEDSMAYLAKSGFEFLTCRELADKHTMIRQ